MTDKDAAGNEERALLAELAELHKRVIKARNDLEAVQNEEKELQAYAGELLAVKWFGVTPGAIVSFPVRHNGEETTDYLLVFFCNTKIYSGFPVLEMVGMMCDEAGEYDEDDHLRKRTLAKGGEITVIGKRRLAEENNEKR